MGLLKHLKMRRTLKEVRCCICGAKLKPEYEDGKEVPDGTDDVYDICYKCEPKFEKWLREKDKKRGKQ